MSRRDNASVRCSRCHLHLSLCFCAHIPSIATRTRLVLVLHRVEARKPTNTGQLAAECLSNSEIWVRGHTERQSDDFTLERHELPLLLFPGKGAIPVTDFVGSAQPVTLIVPDGTWRQASKVQRRVPGLARVTVVSLPQGPASAYHLRREPRDGGLATMEAIARAYGVLEGQEVQRALERVFRIMVERTLWSRGELHTSLVTDGLPEGALQHDPLSGENVE